MKRIVGVIAIATAVLSGCAVNNPDPDTRTTTQSISVAPPERANPTPPQPAPVVAGTGSNQPETLDTVVAVAGSKPITLRQLVNPLMESHGLTMLGNLVELELAKQNAEKPEFHIILTQKDFDAERDLMTEKMFKDSADDMKLQDALDTAIRKKDSDKPNSDEWNKDAAEEARIRQDIKDERGEYLAQFLLNQHVDPVEFEIVLKTNTYLRKILESAWKDKITEEDVHAAFLQMYGEKLEVEYIDLMNMKEVAEAQRRLKDGDKFDDVAKDMSHDGLSAARGGLVNAFSRTSKLPPVFLEAAFALRDGQVSDVVAVGTHFWLIKRIRSIAPKAVKYEQEHDVVRKKLYDTLMDAGLKGMKQQLAVQAHKEMLIIDPMLKQQIKDNADRQVRADQKAKDELERQQRLQQKLNIPPALRDALHPRTAPATGAATQADPAAAGERPPATQPGSIHSFELPKLDTQPSALPNANK